MLDYLEIHRKIRQENVKKKQLQEAEEIRVYGKTMKQMKRERQEERTRNSDHPDAIEGGTALFFYLIAMVGGIIFVDRILIWGAATIIYICYLNRHNK